MQQTIYLKNPHFRGPMTINVNRLGKKLGSAEAPFYGAGMAHSVASAPALSPCHCADHTSAQRDKPLPSELAQVVKAWAVLPAALRADISALVTAALSVA
jgi:hypothetical protein